MDQSITACRNLRKLPADSYLYFLFDYHEAGLRQRIPQIAGDVLYISRKRV